MSRVRWSGIHIAGLWAAVPASTGTVADLAQRFGAAESQKISASTGVIERRLAGDTTCASDLCLEAGSRVLADLGWDASTVDALIFVSQTPDYTLPATAVHCQQRVGLPTPPPV
jgi:3-oxoacyl-[acyl-carrier-protein] synthase-3